MGLSKTNLPLSEEQLKFLNSLPYYEMCRVFPDHSRQALTNMRKDYRERHKTSNVQIDTSAVVEDRKNKKEVSSLKTKLNTVLDDLEKAYVLLGIKQQLLNIDPVIIKADGAGKKHEATAVIGLSDWHCEERVDKESVNDLNEYNIDIFKSRTSCFFENAIKLYKKEREALPINKIVMPVLGDLISGNIHDELLETCTLSPIDASLLAQNTLVGGIQYILDKTKDSRIVITFSSGNHSRITKKMRVATAHGNSLEWFISNNIRNYFKNNDRVNVIANRSYHTYVQVYDTMLRTHHGDAIRYQGGVGGITIPVNKAINEWNKGKRATIDFFGHWHQQLFGRDFISCGSMIGYSPFALKIKAPFERPQQAFFLIDSTFGVTMRAPILLEKVG